MVRPLIFCLGAAALAAGELPLADLLSRVSEEAEMFRQVAPQVLSEETLEQRALKPPPRFHPRLGAAAAEPPKPEYRNREVISEYSYAALKETPAYLREFRQVISVDGRRVRTPEKARHALSLGLHSEDDRARKRMLEDFQKYGLIGAATDFGQLLLIFSRRQIDNYTFRISGTDRIGADEAIVLSYDQRQEADSLVVFEGHQTVHAKLQGQLWVRASDGLPLRISLRSQWKEDRHTRRHEALVEYGFTPFGIVVPASVKHSEYLDDLLIVENVYRYTPFKKFGASAEIKFEVAPEPVKKEPEKK